MRAGDLTTLAHVKAWLAITSDTNDALLLRMIRSASAMALNYTQRTSIALMQYDDVYDGNGNNFMLLRQYPVSEVLSMSFNGTAVQQAAGNGVDSQFINGYVLESSKSFESQQRVTLFGWRFPRGRSLVSVSYKAGYVTTEEFTLPDESPLTVTTSYTWLADEGVTNIDGTLFVPVASDPLQGQYTVDDGVYTFNIADIDVTVLITYSYVPADIEQAVWEMVGERFRYMDRIGYLSKSLGGQETVTFSQVSMSAYVRELLNPFKRVAPV